MTRLGILAAACGLIACASTASAQTPPDQAPAESKPAPVATPAATPPPAAAAPCCLIPAGTPISLELTETLDARSAVEGGHFGFRLNQPIVVDGQTVVPVGAKGVGDIIEAKPAGMAGRGARLLLAVRYIDSGGVHIPVQSLKFVFAGSGAGRDETSGAVVVTMVVGVVGFMVPGGDMVYPTGATAVAKVSVATRVPPVGPAAPSAAPAPAVATSAPDATTPHP
jgi:hypothetical protein